MSDLQMNEEEPRLVVGLGGDSQKGPKLSMEVFLFGVMVLLFGALGFVISKSWGVRALFGCVGLAALCFILQHEYQPRLRQFGLSRTTLMSKRTLVWAGFGVGLAAAELGLIFGPPYVWFLAFPPHRAFTLGLQPLSYLARDPLGLLLAVVVGPILEELLFRGYLYLVFRQNWGRRRAALISSAIFAACHLRNVLFMAKVFVVSLLDIYLNNRAHSLAPSVTEHASYNAAMWLLKVKPP
jgi:membrane protease YdiL (CAAX protease family)